MTKMLFGGAIMSMTAGAADTNTPLHVQNRSRHALVDRFGIDPDGAAILLGPVARKFHGIESHGDRLGISAFLDCYEPFARADLTELIEKFADEGQPFHFTARLASPSDACVHGFIAPAKAENDKGVWTGMLIMSRDQYGAQLSETAN